MILITVVFLQSLSMVLIIYFRVIRVMIHECWQLSVSKSAVYNIIN